MKKVLVGSAVYYHKEYILDKFLQRVAELSYPEYDVVLVDNGKTRKYLDLVEEKIMKLKSKIKFIPKYDTWCDDVRFRMQTAHNDIRRTFLLGDYSHLLLLDQDIIPPINIIEKLLKHNKPVVSALYKIYIRRDEIEGDNKWVWENHPGQSTLIRGRLTREPFPKALENTGLHEWRGVFGFGCVLIERAVLESVGFRYANLFPDMVFYKDIRWRNYKAYIDSNVMCEHCPSEWHKYMEGEIKNIPKEHPLWHKSSDIFIDMGYLESQGNQRLMIDEKF